MLLIAPAWTFGPSASSSAFLVSSLSTRASWSAFHRLRPSRATRRVGSDEPCLIPDRRTLLFDGLALVG